MRVGVIDIGSNTVRLAVYDFCTLKVIKNGVNYAGLIAYVENGEISKEGLLVLCDAVLEMKQLCEESLCDKIHAFATASLRDVKDKESLIKTVFEKTGVLMEIVSGEREAELDYKGLLMHYDVLDGAAFDLGGGSGQLITFENGAVTNHTSKKIGALKLYKQFVKDTFPTEEEEGKIRKLVRNELSDFSGKGYDFIFAMGGAVSALKKLSKTVLGKELDEFSVNDLREFSYMPESVIKAVIPERLYTIRPALIAIEEICKTLKTKRIKITTCGVRDGMIAELKNR